MRKTLFGSILNVAKEMTLYKIMQNSIPIIYKDASALFHSQYSFLIYRHRNTNVETGVERNKHNQTSLGRWQVHHCEKKHELNSYYANTDHCGDYICGSPSILRKRYPKYHGLKNFKID